MKHLILMVCLVLGWVVSARAMDPAGVMDAVNKERDAIGLPPLVLDAQLNRLAGEWAVKAAAEKSLAHRKDLSNIRRSQGWNYINENMFSATGKMDTARLLRTWMKSPGHRANLMNPVLTHGGFGFATNKDGETYAVFNGGVK